MTFDIDFKYEFILGTIRTWGCVVRILYVWDIPPGSRTTSIFFPVDIVTPSVVVVAFFVLFICFLRRGKISFSLRPYALLAGCSVCLYVVVLLFLVWSLCFYLIPCRSCARRWSSTSRNCAVDSYECSLAESGPRAEEGRLKRALRRYDYVDIICVLSWWFLSNNARCGDNTW